MSTVSFELDKDFDVDLDFDFDIDVDIDVDKDFDADIDIDSDVDVEGNAATLLFDVEAVGLDTVVEADVAALAVENELSMVSGSLLAAVD